MACRAVRQRPLHCFQMVLQQDATLFGDASEYCKDAQCGYEGVDKLICLILRQQIFLIIKYI